MYARRQLLNALLRRKQTVFVQHHQAFHGVAFAIRYDMKLKMDKSYPPKIMGQLPFPFSQTKELDESVPIAWRTTDALMPSATQVHEDNSRQPSPTTVRALNWLYALRAATKHRQQHALVDHARSRAMLWHRLYRPHIKIIWGMKCHAPSKPWMKQSLPSCLPTSRWNKNCLNIIS